MMMTRILEQASDDLIKLTWLTKTDLCLCASLLQNHELCAGDGILLAPGNSSFQLYGCHGDLALASTTRSLEHTRESYSGSATVEKDEASSVCKGRAFCEGSDMLTLLRTFRALHGIHLAPFSLQLWSEGSAQLCQLVVILEILSLDFMMKRSEYSRPW